MTSNKPYLVRALYDWICDNNLTPYILVDASGDELSIPFDYVEDNKIVLNISPDAVRDLDLSNDFINFKARFSGQSMNVFFPVSAVLAIYANENGRGMIFQEEDHDVQDESKTVSNEQAEEKKKSSKKPSHLKIVK
jgi:stringent starvation protein B